MDFTLLFISAFWIYGFNYATDYHQLADGSFEYKNILWKAKYYSLKYIGEWWSRPLMTCTICMSSVHGTVFYFASGHTDLIQWIVQVVALSGLVRLLKTFIQ